jgi:hypothetical protein
MTTKNIREFLESLPEEELKERGILRGPSNQLKGISLDPLILLMQEHGVERLEYPPRNWFLDIQGNFKNPGSEELREGKVTDLSNPGSVFNLTNTILNPHYHGIGPAEVEKKLDEAEEIIFGLERDLQLVLRRNIEQLEPGLKVVDGGSERTVEGGRGRIDITAEDKEKKLVVIELKAGTAKPESITQILAYMSSLTQEDRRPIRGILVAAGFHPRVILAAKAVPDLQIKEYSFSFTFRDS